MKKRKELFPNPTTEVGKLIKRRRLQLLIHSCLYYEFDTIIIEDHVYDAWSKELAELLKEHPGAYSDDFDQWFEDWSGETGMHLPHRHPWVYSTAEQLLKGYE